MSEHLRTYTAAMYQLDHVMRLVPDGAWDNPSPCEGFFEPAVVLGQRVRIGDLIGTVCDVLGQRVERIESRYTGLVIVLHTFPTVAKDDSVAVVMEVARLD